MRGAAQGGASAPLQSPKEGLAPPWDGTGRSGPSLGSAAGGAAPSPSPRVPPEPLLIPRVVAKAPASPQSCSGAVGSKWVWGAGALRDTRGPQPGTPSLRCPKEGAQRSQRTAGQWHTCTVGIRHSERGLGPAHRVLQQQKGNTAGLPPALQRGRPEGQKDTQGCLEGQQALAKLQSSQFPLR